MSNRSHSRVKIIFTYEQLEVIKDKKLSIRDVSEKTGISHSVIGNKRRELNLKTGLVKRNDRRKTIFTHEQLEVIKNTSLPSRAVEKLIGISNSVIARKRKELGIKSTGKLNHSRAKKEITANMLVHIKDISKPAHEVSRLIGISESLVRNKRTELGLKPYKAVKIGIKRGEYSKTIKKKQELPVLKIKMIKPKESEWQRQERLKDEAKKVSEAYKLSDAEKIKSGTHKWVRIKNEYGKESLVFRKT